MKSRRAAVLLAAATLLALPGVTAGAGDGFVLRQPLSVVPSGGETDAVGGMEAWLRSTNGHTVVQSVTVWFRGLSDAEGATLWMAPPDSFELEEVADFAVSDNGSGRWHLKADSGWETSPEIPLGLESVLKFTRGLVEVRVPGSDLEDVPVLSASIGEFHFGGIPRGFGGSDHRVKRRRLHRPPAPVASPDDRASGTLRVWRQKGRGDLEDKEQGFDLFAAGFAEDDFYEVWLEDASGEMQFVGETTSTAEGQAYYSVDTRAGDLLPVEADVETVEDLSRRRIEFRRSGFDEPSVVGVVPRIR